MGSLEAIFRKAFVFARSIRGIAVICFAALLMVKVIPNQCSHIRRTYTDEDFLWLGLKWISEKNAASYWKHNPQIATKQEALDFAAKYAGCCSVSKRGVSGDWDIIGRIMGWKHRTVEVIFNRSGPMDQPAKEYTTFYVSLSDCGIYNDHLVGAIGDKALWMKNE